MRLRIRSLLAGATGFLALAVSLRADPPPAATPAATTAATSPAPAPAVAEAPPQPESPYAVPATDDGLPGGGPIRRTEWFRHVWIERRTPWASQVQQDQGALVFLGDSITQGWGDVGSSFPGIKTANRGISGDTSRGVLIRLKEDVLSLNPSGVVLLIGTNDLEERAEPETIAGNVKLIITALRQLNPTMPVVLCEVLPSSVTKNRPVDKIKKLNGLYMGAAALRPVFETVGLAPAWPDDFSTEVGFVSLFDGHDLTGWEYAGGPVFKAKAATDDGRYVVRNGRLVVTVSHKGQENRILWTTTKFPRNFTLKLEFRASPNADSGIFVREPQLQCRDFIIAGPFAILKHYRPLDWNEIVVTVRSGLAHCTCNGEVLVDAMPIPATGPIGLESDHGQIEYRRIRIQEAR